MTEETTTNWADSISEKAMGDDPNFPAPVRYSRALDPAAKLVYVELSMLRRRHLPALESDTEWQLFSFDQLVKRTGLLPDTVRRSLKKLFVPFNLIQVDDAFQQFAMYRVNRPLTYMQTMLLWPSDWLDKSTWAWIKARLPHSGMPLCRWAKVYDNEAVNPWDYLKDV